MCPGKELKFTSSNESAISGDGHFCAFASGLSVGYSEYKDGKCTIPTDGTVTNGQVYAFITNSKSLTDSTVLAGKSPIFLCFAVF